VSVENDQSETGGRLWLAGAGWAVLTLMLMSLLGFGLPVLLAGSLSPIMPRAGLIVGALVGTGLTGATAVLLRRETRQRYAARPRLLRALLIGYTVAMVISVPALLLFLGAAILAALGAH
jgi:hypothetical protein